MDNPIVQELIDFLSTEVEPLVSGDRHTGYANTREPIEYDYHMPGLLKLQNIEHDPWILQLLEASLLTNLVERSSVKDESMDVDAIRNTYHVATDLVPAEAVGETSVHDVLVNIHRIACPIATLCCFDVDEEIGVFRPVFRAGDSPGTNTIADLLVGCQPRTKDQPERWGSLWPSITKRRDLRDPYFRDLYTEEFKSIRTANPGGILGIYVLIFCLQNKFLQGFWPKNECEGCPKFRKSHQAADDEEMSQGPPPDADDKDIPPRTKREVSDGLKGEMERLVQLADVYDEKYNIPTQTIKRPREHAADDERMKDLQSYKELLRAATMKAAKALKFPEEIERQLSRWVLNAAYMLIQVWSHMVRFNGTVARLTCHNLGVIMTRHRKSGTMAVSNFVQHTDKPILIATALTIYAYTDAVERHDLHIANDEPFWLEDPYRGETLAEIKKEPEEDEEEDGDDDEEEDEDAHPPVNTRGGGRGGRGGGGPGRGGRGGGGSSRGGRGGGDQGGSGGKPSGRGGNNTTSKTEQQRQDRQKRMDSRNKKDNIDADNLHLAFRARTKHLWSEGFSHFKRVDAKAVGQAVANPQAQDPTLRGQNPGPVHFPGLALGELPSGQQRRTSGGSSRSSRSTHTNASSLFSEVLSVPPSPATTHFTDISSRDSSPFPEKSVGHPQSSEHAAAATISDVGVVIDDFLGESAIGIVWSGRMILEDGVDDKHSIPIAVKMAVPKETPDGGVTEDDRETVRHEGLVYSFLGMAGNLEISPRYYGVFENSVGSVALVLDYGGTAMKSFNTLTRKQAQILFDKAVAMHAVGVVHNDLEPRNIVQDLEGELRIIDFHVADMGHRCAGKEKCEELLAFSRALKL